MTALVHFLPLTAPRTRAAKANKDRRPRRPTDYLPTRACRRRHRLKTAARRMEELYDRLGARMDHRRELAGGLGNQMFIYAFARALGLRCNEPVTLLDRQDWKDGPPPTLSCALNDLSISPGVQIR